MPISNNSFDVIIIGGSYAGLSAAMALGRSMKNVLIIDSGKPCNRMTPHSHNFLTQDGQTPQAISNLAKSQVLEYPTVQFQSDLAVSGQFLDDGFAITTEGGVTYTSTKLIIATGIKDIMPDIPGFAESWGITLVHCPYCHGYELRGLKTAIFAEAEKALHLAPLIKNLTNDLTVVTSGQYPYSDDQIAQLKAMDVDVVQNPIQSIVHDSGKLQEIQFVDRPPIAIKAMYAGLPFVQHCNIPKSLGCTINDHGYIEVSTLFKTSVEGIYACGDNCGRMRSVANAVYSGNVAGAIANMELTGLSLTH